MMFTICFTAFKYQLTSLLIFGLSLLATQCGAAPAATPERITEIRFEHGSTEPKLISTEKIPLNNCNGNSALKMDIERSREFVYAVIDKNGYQFGGEYGFLKGLLEREYDVVDGEKETQTHTLHLETEANSHVIYAIAWKETLLNGQAVIEKDGQVDNVPYKVKKGLTLEVEQVEKIDCK